MWLSGVFYYSGVSCESTIIIQTTNSAKCICSISELACADSTFIVIDLKTRKLSRSEKQETLKLKNEKPITVITQILARASTTFWNVTERNVITSILSHSHWMNRLRKNISSWTKSDSKSVQRLTWVIRFVICIFFTVQRVKYKLCTENTSYVDY